MSREVWSARSVHRAREPLIDTRLAIAGDTHSLPAAFADRRRNRDATCLVWAIDLRTSPRTGSAKRRLARATDEVISTARRMTVLNHVVVLYTLAPHHDAEAARRTAEASAARLHAFFERRRATYVEVLFVETTGCADPSMLRTRIATLATVRPGAAGNGVVHWQDLVDRSLHQATMDDLS